MENRKHLLQSIVILERRIDFNVRFGNPETEVILPRILTPLDEILFKLMNHEHEDLKSDPCACLGKVMASKGYP